MPRWERLSSPLCCASGAHPASPLLQDPALRARLLLAQLVPALAPEAALINGSLLGTMAGPRFVMRVAVQLPPGGIVSGAPKAGRSRWLGLLHF